MCGSLLKVVNEFKCQDFWDSESLKAIQRQRQTACDADGNLVNTSRLWVNYTQNVLSALRILILCAVIAATLGLNVADAQVDGFMTLFGKKGRLSRFAELKAAANGLPSDNAFKVQASLCVIYSKSKKFIYNTTMLLQINVQN